MRNTSNIYRVKTPVKEIGDQNPYNIEIPHPKFIKFVNFLILRVWNFSNKNGQILHTFSVMSYTFYFVFFLEIIVVKKKYLT
jgi:hypothetical protein